MSWYSSMMPETAGCENVPTPDVDRLARRLAKEAGEDWDLMPKHPGFERGRWRDRAERTLELVGGH